MGKQHTKHTVKSHGQSPPGMHIVKGLSSGGGGMLFEEFYAIILIFLIMNDFNSIPEFWHKLSLECIFLRIIHKSYIC